MPGDRYGQKWSEEETILAFYLYCQIPFSKVTKTNPDIIRLANLLGRTPSSVGLKLSNLPILTQSFKIGTLVVWVMQADLMKKSLSALSTIGKNLLSPQNRLRHRYLARALSS